MAVCGAMQTLGEHAGWSSSRRQCTYWATHARTPRTRYELLHQRTLATCMHLQALRIRGSGSAMRPFRDVLEDFSFIVQRLQRISPTTLSQSGSICRRRMRKSLGMPCPDGVQRGCDRGMQVQGNGARENVGSARVELHRSRPFTIFPRGQLGAWVARGKMASDILRSHAAGCRLGAYLTV